MTPHHVCLLVGRSLSVTIPGFLVSSYGWLLLIAIYERTIGVEYELLYRGENPRTYVGHLYFLGFHPRVNEEKTAMRPKKHPPKRKTCLFLFSGEHCFFWSLSTFFFFYLYHVFQRIWLYVPARFLLADNWADLLKIHPIFIDIYVTCYFKVMDVCRL